MYLARTVEVALWEPWNVENSLRGRDPNRNFGFSLHPSQPSRISPPQEAYLYRRARPAHLQNISWPQDLDFYWLAHKACIIVHQQLIP